MAIIRSIFDNDLYKFSMQKAVLSYRQHVPVKYRFNNRRPDGKFNSEFGRAFKAELLSMRDLKMTADEHDWAQSRLHWLGDDYIQYLKNFRFNPSEVEWWVDDGNLRLAIDGSWEKTILWEVPLMSIISELYFEHCDKDWKFDENEQTQKLIAKGDALSGLNFTDFGTRRRRSYEVQKLVVQTLRRYETFRGTSNVHFAHIFDVKPLGTMAHEWIMGISALEGLLHANKHAMRIWSDVYKGNLGTALTDTFGSAAFFNDFDGVLARLFDGLRHDSGNPIEFAEKSIKAYKNLGINPMTKTIIFSDGLDVTTTLRIAKELEGRINFSFGIGTHLSNDFMTASDPDVVSKALNMVIKMMSCNGVNTVKISDVESKIIGERDAVRVALWTFFNTPLDTL